MRSKKKNNFFKKYLVWQVIDQHGNISEAYISTGISGEVYLNYFLSILKYHIPSTILFWPDLTTCHYACSVTPYLKDKSIEFVTKKKIYAQHSSSVWNWTVLGPLLTGITGIKKQTKKFKWIQENLENIITKKVLLINLDKFSSKWKYSW